MSSVSLPVLNDTKIVSFFSSNNPRYGHFHTALLLAVLLHLLLVILVPDIREFKFTAISRGSVINVFLSKVPEPQPFKQNLEQQQSGADQVLVEPSLGAANREVGDDELVTEQAPEVESQGSGVPAKTPSGSERTEGLQPRVRLDISTIRLFAKQEAVRYAERHPDKVERFRRSFNSRRSYQRRNTVESYKNRYGDQYVRSHTESGDICFKQQREVASSALSLSTNTVYFFRCDRKPKGLEIKP